MAALDGMVVLDLTRLLPGAAATQALRREGAEVIKIERPGEGDYARTLSPEVFARTNAGKKSVALDLKRDGGRRALMRLARGADVLIESFRPGAMERLGLGYGALAAVNERLVYASLSGYGQTGEDAGMAGHDINYIAMGGLLGLNRCAGNRPAIPGVQIADLAGGAMQAVLKIALALLERTRTGRGAWVDVSMTEGVRGLLEIPVAEYLERGRSKEMLSGRYACYNVYEAKDGRWLAVGALEAKFWSELCTRVGCPELAEVQYDEARQEEAKARLGRVFAARDAEAWFEDLREFDCCVTPVRTVAEVASGMRPDEDGSVPGIGEHTEEVLRAAEYSDGELAEMRAEGAIA